MNPDRPNVVFVITDDQGLGDFGFTGNPVIRTPNIDALSRESVFFSDFHVGPTCAPTRASVFTGRYHNSTGVWHTIGGRSLLRADEYTLASAFRGAGYRTGIFGKWHLGDAHPYRPHERGFDEAVVHGGGGIGQTPDYWNNDYFDDTYFANGEPKRFSGYCTDVFFRLGTDFIERCVRQDTPFLCVIPTNAPHVPWQVPKKYEDLYAPCGIGDRARFYGMITNIDENVGALRARLSALQIERDTVFIFMTDNGTSGGCRLGSNGLAVDGYNCGMRGTKASVYEGGHRVPFLVRYPSGGIDGPRVIDALTANVDIMPTLLDICGILPSGHSFDGVSLRTLLCGEGNMPELADRIVVTDSQRVPNPVKWRNSCAMRGAYRLINGKELYHIKTDPGEQRDIAGVCPDVVRALRAGYEAWWDRVSARFPEEIPFIAGSDDAREICLTAHDLRGDVGDCAWNQGEIRRGKRVSRYWELDFARDGEYMLELRRWPREDGDALRASLPGALGGDLDWWSGGVALDIVGARAWLEGEAPVEVEIGDNDAAALLVLRAKKGPAHLYARFIERDGAERGAYYAYLRRMGDV